MRGIGDNGGPSNVFQVSRDIFNHPLVGAGNGGVDPWSRMEAWEWLLATARYRPGEILIRGEVVTIEVGQLVTTFKGLADQWKWTVKKVRTFLGQLQQEGMIDRKTGMGEGTPKGAHASVVTICNYGLYQFLEDYLGQQKGQPNGQPKGNPTAAQGQQKKKEEEGIITKNCAPARVANPAPNKPWAKRDPFGLNRWQAEQQSDVWFDADGMLQVANGFKADLENILEDPGKLRAALNKAAGWVGVGEPPAQLKIKVRAQVQRQVDEQAAHDQRFAKRYGAPPSALTGQKLERPPDMPGVAWRNQLRGKFKNGELGADVLHANGVKPGTERTYE